MTRLRQRDLAAFSQALTTLYAEVGADTLSARILASLRGLFDCDFATFSLIDLRKGHFHGHAIAPFVVDLPGVEIHQRHLPSDPAAAYLRRTKKPHAVKISDFVGLREYRNLGVYTEVFGRVKCDRRLGFAVQDRSPVSLIATLNRRGRDFSDGDRTLLDLLRPHLLQANAHANADTRSRLDHERERARLGDVFEVGMGEVDAAGRLVWLTPRAETLLRRFSAGEVRGVAARRLPARMDRRLALALRQRLGSGLPHEPRPPGRLAWRIPGPDGRALRVRLVAQARPDRWLILLEESRSPVAAGDLARAFKLTPREAEVFQWLKQGKTNWEIGAIVGAAEKTVGKHLENIFAKLRVENRVAAVRMAAEPGAVAGQTALRVD